MTPSSAHEQGLEMLALGSGYQDRGDPVLALQHYERALELLESGESDRGAIGVCLNNIGLIYANRGDPGRALEYYERSLQIAEAAGDRFDYGVTLNNFGNVYASQGDLAKALEYHKRALEITESIEPNSEQVSGIHHSMAAVYRARGELSKALEHVQRASELAPPSSITSVACHQAMGTILADQGNLVPGPRTIRASKGDSANDCTRFGGIRRFPVEHWTGT